MLLLIILVSLLSCSAQLCQKQATRAVSRRTRLSWIGVSVLLLGVAMLLWLLVLQRVPVSQAYPMLSLNFIFVALAGRLLWRERLTLRQITGTLLVVTGVALMASQI
ncbi:MULTISPECIES: 4-amino-4-deoxy-L-arabinose-phosphoundecaprenol flippase subunit ArnE [unclassified Pantoea]|uniref:4-amino-4-deoxy-L-arabinose-phosphoundecaprenol flippase subunit ArnE n=1 Tax=unclassified Pantoea TaxID=2630326 RepID=UPI001231C0DB|nr:MULTISPECIES: 4-amino-4-deoxy-L-arabinose-phosphoundecaprenol flippase subunit ArnE [unclassified Pantoea]KAA5967110.1 EamA family transporter [Pantoea sp. M_6]KAA5973908.1 EamA family transporter [Pantoea sp. M_8]KAA5987098.1 EamA family transporter [Pantoea sp. M_10]KAA6000909.1 EamA family transporter [Pantoea sp. M_5]